MSHSLARKQLLADTATLYARAARLLDPVRLRVWEELGITLPQLRILFLVRNRPGSDLRSLAAQLGIGASAASQQVERLVERGFLARAEDSDDRRRLQLALTARGQEAVGEISKVSRDYSQRLLAPLSDEQLAALAGLLTALLAEAGTATPPQLGERKH